MKGSLQREEHSKQWMEGTEGTSPVKEEVFLRNYGDSGIELQLFQIMAGLEKAKECNFTGITE